MFFQSFTLGKQLYTLCTQNKNCSVILYTFSTVKLPDMIDKTRFFKDNIII